MVGNIGGAHPTTQVQQTPSPTVKIDGRKIETSYKAMNSIMSGDELMRRMGAPPKSDIMFGGKVVFTRSVEYKDAIQNLNNFQRQVSGFGDQTAKQSPIQFAALKATLQDVIDSCASYKNSHTNDQSKTGRRNVMTEVEDSANKMMARLDKMDGASKAHGDMPVKTALAMLEGGIANAGQFSTYLNDASIGEVKLLGAGAINQVYSAVYIGPQTMNVMRVLKPLTNEKPSTQLADPEVNIGLDAKDLRIAARNLASAEVAGMIGLSGLIPKPDIVVHLGQACLAMPVAEGQEFLGSRKEKATGAILDQLKDAQRQIDSPNTPENFKEMERSVIRNYQASKDGDDWMVSKTVVNNWPLTGDDQPELTGNLQKAMLDLQAVDLLCGQADRHAHNFFVKIDGNTVELTGIDNDTAFGVNSIGIDRPGNRGGFVQPPFPGPPPLMSREAFAGLKTIEADLPAYRQRLENTGLNTKEVDAAMSRVDALLDHADKLEEAGCIVDDFATWKGTDAKSGVEMNASEFIMASDRDSYVKQCQSAADAFTGDGIVLQELDSTKHGDLSGFDV